MKTRKTAFIIALMAALTMASCGEINADSSSSNEQAAQNAPAASAAEEEQTEEQTSENAEAESTEDTASNEEGTVSAEESIAPETESTGEVTGNNELTNFVFETPNGDFSYQQLCASGLANTTADGVYYALVSNGGGAGHAFYKVWSTEATGEWAEAGDYQALNGNNTFIALDNGKIIKFYYNTAACEPYPHAALLSYTGGTVIDEVDNPSLFDYTTFEDGQKLDAHGEITFSAEYLGDFTFWLTFQAADGTTLEKEFKLDPNTLSVTE